MHYRLLSLIENAPDGFLFRRRLEQRDVRRWPFALLASSRAEAEAALAPFDTALAGIIITFDSEQGCHQCAPLLFHLIVPHELRARLPVLLHSHLVLLESCQQIENGYAEQTLKLMRAREESFRNMLEFTLIKKSLVEELFERRRAEDELYKNKLQYDNLVSKISVGIFLLHTIPEGSFVLDYVSPRMAEILNVSVESLMADSQIVCRTIHPDDLDSFVKLYREGVQHQQPFAWEGRALVKGTVKCLHFRLTPEPLESEDVLWHGVITDITKRKQVEEKLRKSETLYHSLVETSQDLIWQCDAEGRYIYLNLAWEQLFGYELDEMLGKKYSDFQTPENAERDLIAFNRLMQGNSIDHYETTYIGRNGNEIHLVFNALFVSDEHGKIVGASGTAHNITQRKQMEEELRQAKDAAEAANIAKSQFLATMSHEIRTPMNGVIGMIELLQHTELTPEQYEYAESAKSAGIELVHLLNDILDLSKIEADKIELEASDFDLRPVISDTINLLSLQAREKGVKLTSSIDTDVPTALKGDAGRLRQIITNLVGNAIKFTPKGTVTLQIRERCRR